MGAMNLFIKHFLDVSSMPVRMKGGNYAYVKWIVTAMKHG